MRPTPRQLARLEALEREIARRSSPVVAIPSLDEIEADWLDFIRDHVARHPEHAAAFADLIEGMAPNGT